MDNRNFFIDMEELYSSLASNLDTQKKISQKNASEVTTNEDLSIVDQSIFDQNFSNFVTEGSDQNFPYISMGKAPFDTDFRATDQKPLDPFAAENIPFNICFDDGFNQESADTTIICKFELNKYIKKLYDIYIQAHKMLNPNKEKNLDKDIEFIKFINDNSYENTYATLDQTETALQIFAVNVCGAPIIRCKNSVEHDGNYFLQDEIGNKTKFILFYSNGGLIQNAGHYVFVYKENNSWIIEDSSATNNSEQPIKRINGIEVKYHNTERIQTGNSCCLLHACYSAYKYKQKHPSEDKTEEIYDEKGTLIWHW